MKKQNKTLVWMLVLTLLLLPLAGCTAKQGNAPSQGDEKITIGIIQSVEHLALDQCYDGFVKALDDNGYSDKVTLDYQNAQGDTSSLSTIADRFVSHKVDLVLSITTGATQAMAAKTTEIPILATAVTSYTVAGLIDSDEAPGGNISGTSDMNPVAAQVELIKTLVPEVKTVGLAYNAGEDNSALQAKLAKEQIERMGLSWTEVTVTNSSEVQQAIQSLVTKCEAIYIPTDNTVSSAMATVHSVTIESKTPTICGADTMVLEGGLATMGISYYDLGYKTGLMAIEVIEGAKVGDMPIQYADRSDAVTINGQVAEEIGYQVPDQYKDAVVYPES
ncbi:MAG: ABC transporter substrate-binding protein [Clostridiales bacterium]|nr:ABC transporter substrate-binding protein [Clostridiales bacterium]